MTRDNVIRETKRKQIVLKPKIMIIIIPTEKSTRSLKSWILKCEGGMAFAVI